MEESTLEDEFNRRVKQLSERAKAAGTNVSELCRIAGVSRTTPERWNKRVPKSITIFDSVFQALLDLERAKGEEEEAFKNLPLREQERLKAQRKELEREKEKERRLKRNEARRESRARLKNAQQD
ncbi:MULTISPECIES: hypothetical protein [Leclercia]|uniref:Uncharacterized protein n=1 Tax=Leclercia barmai TaxID=2785629 RepID=A0ABS7RWL7_9ENTR|nr:MULTISPECIES: hypothetical protein [Leclercia]MBZ0058708.1 hypothetical protein [Leclercia sp. EMC7]MCM5696118.1 hypothetical protein [Leclercia sp. LTM01]MCM5702365.1 hypothetical protein [Leclercia sp. LTM14]